MPKKSLRIQLRAKRALEHLKKITKENKTAFTNNGSQLQHRNVNITVVSLMSQKLPVPNRNGSDYITAPQSELSKLKEESVKTKITESELQKKNEELLSDVKEKNISLKEKEEINLCHGKQFQLQKKGFDSELKNEHQKLAEILENNEKFSEVISEENVSSEEREEMCACCLICKIN
ncbi:hypothetical protein TNCV_4057891 [Trichonephila clavipes]|nr:hypothetical protein TNCV_4057891 [Trichonephila clavipes]